MNISISLHNYIGLCLQWLEPFYFILQLSHVLGNFSRLPRFNHWKIKNKVFVVLLANYYALRSRGINCASCENNISVAAAVIKDMVVLILCKRINMWMVGKPLNHPFLFYIYLFLVVGKLFGMTFGSERILILAKKLCNSCFYYKPWKYLLLDFIFLLHFPLHICFNFY